MTDATLKKHIGERITNSNTVYTVIGVVENFNFESMKRPIRPLCLSLADGGSIAAVKVKSHNMPGTLASLSVEQIHAASTLPLFFPR